MPAAVNSLVGEPGRSLVCGVFGRFQDGSAIPSPLLRCLPSCATRTLPPLSRGTARRPEDRAGRG